MNGSTYFNNSCALTSMLPKFIWKHKKTLSNFYLFLTIISITTYLLNSLTEPMLPLIAAVPADRLLPLLASAEQNVHKYILDHY